MTTIIYLFQIKVNQEEQFLIAWKEMTNLIYQYENSLGSKLFKQKDDTYIATAQWPDEFTWKKSGNNIPAEAKFIRAKMKDTCEKIEILYEFNLVADLIRNDTYNSKDNSKNFKIKNPVR